MTEEQKQQVVDLLRSGKYTSEFWLSLAAQVVGALLASGLLTDTWGQVAGVIAMVLGAMGYTYNRTQLKNKGLDLINEENARDHEEKQTSIDPETRAVMQRFADLMKKAQSSDAPEGADS